MSNKNKKQEPRIPDSNWKSSSRLVILLFGLVAIFIATNSNHETENRDLRNRFNLEVLGPIPYPPNNPPISERIMLGRLLFFDPILGGEKDVSCGTCHHPDFAFADFRQFSAGTSGSGLGPMRLLSESFVTGDPILLEPRNSPTIFNTAFNGDVNGLPSHLGFQFMDGRVNGLEKQAEKPISSRVEMRGDAYPGSEDEAAAASLGNVLQRLRAIPEYVELFKSAFPEDANEKPGVTIIDAENYSRALAAYERELVTRNSAYDRYVMGDDNAISDIQKEGMLLFFTKAGCSACHSGPMFSDFSFVVQGVPQEGTGKSVIPGDDTGREEHTKKNADRYAFRTLTLRNVELTAPYMHDGVFETLEEVIRFYNDGSQPRHPEVTDDMLDSRLLDANNKPIYLGLTDHEINAIVEFLKALTDPGTDLPDLLLTVPEKVPSGLTPVFGVRAEQTDITNPVTKNVCASNSGLLPSIVGTPLTYSEHDSPTLLASIPPDKSGLDFINQLSLENQINYTNNGAGLATGDYDNDGLPDVFLINEEGQNKLYRNNGSFHFSDTTESAGLTETKGAGGFSIGAYFADINNDGNLDLFITNWMTPNRLFINNGDGTFSDITEQAGVGYAGGSTTATFADYDRDCDLDFFVATYRPRPLEFELSDPLDLAFNSTGAPIIPETYQGWLEVFPKADNGWRIYQMGEPDMLYQNNGDGTFTEVAQSAGITGNFWGLSAMFTDVDNDNWPDLYVTNDFWSPNGFYRNRGDGTFEPVNPEMYQHNSMYSMGVDFADINNDGFLDYFVGDMMSRDPVLSLTQHGEEMLQPPQIYSHPMQVMRNTLHLNNGDGSYSDIAFLADVADTEWTWSVKFADLDLDGFVDLLITNGMLHDIMDSDATLKAERMNDEGQIQSPQEYAAQFPRLDDPNMVFRNLGDLRFEDVSKTWGFYKKSISMGLSLTDLDSDGDFDILVNPINEPVMLYENTSTAHRLAIRLKGQVSNSQGLGARVTLTTSNGTQTRIMTSSGGYLSSHEPLIIFGLGKDTNILELKVEWPSGHIQVFSNESSETLKVDMRYTIIEPGDLIHPPVAAQTHPDLDTQFQEVGIQSGLIQPHIEAPYDPFMENHLLPRSLAHLGPGLSWADVDGDNDDDLYMAGAAGQRGVLYLNDNGAFTFDVKRFGTFPKYEELAPLFWHNGISPTTNLLLSYSKIEHAAPLIGSASGDWQSESIASGGGLASADFDGDGDLDIFAGGRTLPGTWPKTAPSALFENQNGILTDVTSHRAPDLLTLGQSTGAVWLDVDTDGDPDLLIASEWGPIHLLKNINGMFIESSAEAGLIQWTGLWTGLTIGDYNGDGNMDFAAANLGLNTRYTASPSHPLTLFAGDVDLNGTHDIIEAKWVGDALHPDIERGMMGMQVPFVLEKFDTFKGYAEASLSEIFGDALNKIERYEAATLAHSLFLNDGMGHFTRTDLPYLAQASSGYGIVTADFDNDGYDDLYIAGNYSHADMMTMAYDGGTSYWLRGRGNGTFSVIPSRESGLLVPYDARGVAVSDYDSDGWVDIAVGINNSRPMLFHNAGQNGNNSITIRLIGPMANPHGVGARITITRMDGSTTTRELLSGSGYFSQDSVVLVFGAGISTAVSIQVIWPDGHITIMENVSTNQQVTIKH